MIKMKGAFSGLLIFFSTTLLAQQPEVYNQFFMNPYLYNPAYAGVDGHSVLFLMYQQQWTNIDGAPRIAHASFHTPLEGGIGIGAAFYNYATGPIQKNVGKVSGSYLLTFDRKHYLRFGLSVGGGSQNLTLGEIDDPTDPAFASLANSNSFMVSDFGVTYHSGHFNFGVSMPNLISYDYFQNESFAPIRVQPLDNLILKANYRGHINNDIAIEPHVLYRYRKFAPSQFEATVIAHIYHIVWVGATYRQDNTYVFNLGTKIAEKLAVGYAYELGNTDINSFLGPSHEVHIGYHIGRRKSHAEHSSSFIKSHRLSKEEREELAEQERQQRIAEIEAARAAAMAENDADEDALDIAKPTEETPKTDSQAEEIAAGAVVGAVVAGGDKEDEGTTIEEEAWKVDEDHQPVKRVNEYNQEEEAFIVEHQNEEGENEYALAWRPTDESWELLEDEPPLKRTTADGNTEVGIKYLDTDAQGNKTQIIKWEPVLTATELEAILSETKEPQEEPFEQPEDYDLKEDPAYDFPPEEQEIDNTDPAEYRPTNTEETEEVTRGNHMLELPSGVYVIAGAFRSFERAENYSDDMFQRGFKETIVGFNSQNELYYVVIHRSKSTDTAQGFKNRHDNKPGLEEIWILKVN